MCQSVREHSSCVRSGERKRTGAVWELGVVTRFRVPAFRAASLCGLPGVFRVRGGSSPTPLRGAWTARSAVSAPGTRSAPDSGLARYWVHRRRRKTRKRLALSAHPPLRSYEEKTLVGAPLLTSGASWRVEKCTKRGAYP